MNWARTVYHVARNQARKVRRIAVGKPALTPSLGSMTVDLDDVELAKDWLSRDFDWYETDTVERFEVEFAEWNGSKHAFSFASARVGLTACIHALSLEPGDEVLIPGYTCVVVANAFRYRGIRVRYADIELDTYGLDIESVKDVISPRTKAILIHHLYGLVSRDYIAIVSFARTRGITVIEDCAQATGAEMHGRKVGNLGDIAFYSSEQSKVFSTVEGGLAVTNDPALAARLREFQNAAPFPSKPHLNLQLRTQIKNYYESKHPMRYLTGDLCCFRYGVNRVVSTTSDEMNGIRPPDYGCRMAAPIAALGLIQLRKLDAYNEARRRSARMWDEWCDRQGYQRPVVLNDSTPIWLRYPVCVTPQMKRDLSWAEKSLRVRPGVWFTGNLHPSSVPVPGCPRASVAVAQCINFPTLQ